MYRKFLKQNSAITVVSQFGGGGGSQFIIFVEYDFNLTATNKLHIHLHVLNYLHQLILRATELRYLLITDGKKITQTVVSVS